MRFKSSIKNINTFNKFVSSLASIGDLAWIRLDTNSARFTVIPETGSQVWATLSIDTVFDDYAIESRGVDCMINLEVPIVPLQRALKSAVGALSATLRLTKKDKIPILALTITHRNAGGRDGALRLSGVPDAVDDDVFFPEPLGNSRDNDHETIVTQEIPIRILAEHTVEGIHEPVLRQPEVHVVLPPLLQLKAVSDRFTKLALSAVPAGAGLNSAAAIPKLEFHANMHGTLKLRISTDALTLESVWTGLTNPDLDPTQAAGGLEEIAEHPATKLQQAGPDAWAKVRIDGRDWGKVLSVGRVAARVIACFVDGHAVIMYVSLPRHPGGYATDEESVLTYYISSYIA